MSRGKDEASIHRLDTTFGREFERALGSVLSRHPGLSFWTDEQIAEIRRQMVADAWSGHQIVRGHRRAGRALMAAE